MTETRLFQMDTRSVCGALAESTAAAEGSAPMPSPTIELPDLTNLVIWRKIGRVKNKFVNVAAAKARLPELIERAAGGETIILARSGKPRAKLVPLEPSPTAASKRTPGKGKGRFRMKKGFEQPLPEHVLAAFEGSS